MLLLIIGLLLFVLLVVVHEFGHFIAARKNGVEVEEFGVGFPPRAKVLGRKNGTVYTLNWLPLGGFVKLKGEHDADTARGSFGAASLGAKVLIMIAGVAMNLATAFVLLTLLAVLGMPKLVDNQFTVASDTKVVKSEVLVGYIEEGSPASQAGLKEMDQIISINEDSITTADKLSETTEKYAGQTVTIRYERQGEEREVTAELLTSETVEASRETDDPKGYLGVAQIEYVMQRSTWSAPIVAAGLIKQFTQLTFRGLGTAISGLFQGDTAKASSQVAGPVGIFVLLKDGSLLGYQFIILVIAVISLTLAIMNVLPIPALDGGRLFVTLLYRVLRRPLSKEVEDRIHGTGFALLMMLFVLITIVDVRRFF